MKAYEHLSLQQVDKRLESLKPYRTAMRTSSGWIHTMRTTLGLSTYHLAKLMHLKQPSVMALEQREKTGAISLESLEKVAEAMGCDLFYAFIPKTSLQDFVSDHEHKHVESLLKKTHLTMSLEKQGLKEEELAYQKELMVKEMQSKSLKSLWRNYDF